MTYAANPSRLARAFTPPRCNLGANGGYIWPHHRARQDTLRSWEEAYGRAHFRRKWAWRSRSCDAFPGGRAEGGTGPGQSPVAAGLCAWAFSGPLAMASAGPRKSPGEVSRTAGLGAAAGPGQPLAVCTGPCRRPARSYGGGTLPTSRSLRARPPAREREPGSDL